MMSQNIKFKKMLEADLKLLHQWFQIPHVLKWYARDESYTFDMIKTKYLPRLNDLSILSYIIYDQDKPVGYIQFYQVKYHFPEGMSKDHPLFNSHSLKNTAICFNQDEIAGIDLFIADENYLHIGFSSKALTAFIDEYMKGNYKAILVDPMKANNTAIKFFEKNGFNHISSQEELHDLMIKIIA